MFGSTNISNKNINKLYHSVFGDIDTSDVETDDGRILYILFACFDDLVVCFNINNVAKLKQTVCIIKLPHYQISMLNKYKDLMPNSLLNTHSSRYNSKELKRKSLLITIQKN